MFKSYKFHKWDSVNKRDLYQVTDTDFQCLIHPSGPLIVYELFLEYKSRKLDIASNLALYYYFEHNKGYRHVSEWIEEDKQYLDSSHPEIKYGEKYYPKIKEHYNKLIMLS